MPSSYFMAGWLDGSWQNDWLLARCILLELSAPCDSAASFCFTLLN
jgi:hypothetical protein